MARRTKLDIVREAIAINGHISVPSTRGEMRIREIRGVASNGAWITDHLTADLGGYVRLKKAYIPTLVAKAEDIIRRRDEITAGREHAHRVAMGHA